MSLTKWEAGQCLVSCVDHIYEREEDLRKGGHAELAAFLREIRLTLGDKFNEIDDSAGFALPSHDLEKARDAG